jgi:hypothetical protein
MQLHIELENGGILRTLQEKETAQGYCGMQ